MVCGGGSGDEAGEGGFVGEGMVDGVVCGEMLSSPRGDKILDGIKGV
ncbi:dihydroxyacetone kinase subunit DhaK, partial [Staphylococcus epidermidis]